MDGREFLHSFYNINSYEDMLNWLESNGKLTTVTTKHRVVDYSFMLFNNKNIVINDDIVNVYIEYYKLCKEELYDVFKNHVSNNKLVKKKQSGKTSRYQVYEYVSKYVITPSIIYDFLDMIKNTYNTIDIDKYEFMPIKFMLEMLLKFILAKIK